MYVDHTVTVYVQTYTRIYIYTHVYIHTHTYINTYTYIYIYTHTQTRHIHISVRDIHTYTRALTHKCFFIF